jgi:hypothetical protein
VTDPLYVRDPVSGAYRPLQSDDRAGISSGEIRI